MKHRIISWLISLVLLAASQLALAVPSIWGEWEWEHEEAVHLMVSPGSGGEPFTEATYFGGAPTDATIRVQLWFQDDNLQDPQPPAPVPNFPAEDIWLEVLGLVACQGSAHADGNTDAEGWFTFSLPLALGGWADPDGGDPYPYVMVAGSPLFELNGPAIRPNLLLNSPDINADGQVNLADLNLFATDFFGANSFRSDFHWDGVINLADVGRFATCLGAGCP